VRIDDIFASTQRPNTTLKAELCDFGGVRYFY